MKIDRTDFIKIMQDNVSEIDVSRIAGDRRLVDIGVDSLGFATLLFAIEDKLGVHIDENELEGLNGNSTLKELSLVFQRLGYEIEV